MSHDHHREHHSHHDHGELRSTPRRGRRSGSGLVFGIILLTAGAMFLLDNLGMVEVERYFDWWPLVFIAIGLGELIGGSRTGAAIWMSLGGLFLLYNFDRIQVNPFQIFWPVLMTIVGSILIWQGLSRRSGGKASRRMSAFAFMAGNVQRASFEAIESVQATAVMGGCEIDLRNMKSGEGETIVDVFAMWGGIEIAIPEGWDLDNRVTPILAGVEDRTAPPAPDAPRVTLRGTVVMGGIEVKN